VSAFETGSFTGVRNPVKKQSVTWKSKPLKLKKAFIVMWLLGIILIFSFRTPVKYYEFYDRFVVIYTHVFSNRGKILAGQLVLYLFIWSAFIFLVYWAFKILKASLVKPNA
jgi:hypothetical protein